MEEHWIDCPRCREKTRDRDLVLIDGHMDEVCPACGGLAEAAAQDGEDLPTRLGVLWRRRCDDCGDWWDAQDVAITPRGRECCFACTPKHVRKRAESALDAMIVLANFLATADDLERGWLTSMLRPGYSEPPPNDRINYSKLINEELSELTYKA